MSGIAPHPPASASRDDPPHLLDLEGPAVLDFLRGQQALAGHGSAQSQGTAAGQPERPALPGDCEPARHGDLVYLPTATTCYAIVLYDVASARVVRRVSGLFGDADCAEDYARASGYHLYDVVPATAVVPKIA